MLELKNVAVRYGAIQAVTGVSLQVAKGEVVCLIGANGAGKSSVLNAISGVVAVVDGSITFEGDAIRGARAGAIVRKGLIQVPEGRLVFPDMTVLENLEMGAYSRRDSTIGHARHGDGAVPSPGRTSHSAGRPHVWRRAADAGHRPRTDGQAPPAAARRAVDGPGAAGNRRASSARSGACATNSMCRSCSWSRTPRPR